MQPPQTSLAYRDMPDHLVGRSGLRRHAGIFHLWALGVGAVISGDFFGWNFGLLSGGFGGLLAALAIMTLLYLCLCLSLAEMSPAMPHAGGAYSFARTALGPWCGYITGLAENIEYIFTPAVIVVGAGGYLGAAVVAVFLRAVCNPQRRRRRSLLPRFGGDNGVRARGADRFFHCPHS